MKLLLFANNSCYPCERAQSELYHAGLSYEKITKPDPRFVEFNIIGTPVLVFLDEEGNEVARLTGAHNIKRIEIQGLIKDHF